MSHRPIELLTQIPAPTILVVDDEPSIRTMLSTALSMYGYCVATAPRVEDALAVLHNQRVNAVVLDVQMPGPSGLELLAYLRGDPGRQTLPVIILTGAELTEEQQALAQRHGAQVLYKPESHVALVEVLQQLTGPT